ncbi:MAG: hypothetical protein M0T73_05675 [Deltaproteobacteria bacterium]|nr:hypothetical protein [Deltaproteobacteria bacterium]
MKNTLINTRVRSLEEMMADLIATVEQTSLEMREFKDEWRHQSEESKKEWRDEMREFAELMQCDTAKFKESTNEILDRTERENAKLKGSTTEILDRMQCDTVKFKESTNEILDRMERENAKFKEDSKRDRRELNKQLGEIANKQGRMTEDLVAPSICRILREVVRCPRRFECGSLVRPRRTHPLDKSRLKEFDVIADCGDYVLVNETKSNLGPEDIGKLMDTIEEVREYFPEFRDRKFIGLLATLYAEESLIKFASRKGILVLTVGDELMDVKNEPGFKAAIF